MRIPSIPTLIVPLVLLGAPTANSAQRASLDGDSTRGGELEELLPADVFAFATFAGLDRCSDAAEGLALFELWNEPEMQRFVAPLLDQFRAVAGHTPPELAERWKAIKSHMGGRISIAFSDLTLMWVDGGPVPVPAAIMAIDFRGSEDFARQSLGELLDLRAFAEIGLDHRTIQKHGVEVHILEPVRREPLLQIHYAMVDGLLLVDLNGHLLERCLEVRSGAPIETLGGSDSFAKARSQARANPLVEVFVDAEAFGSRVRGLVPIEVREAVHTLGLDSIRSIYYASSVHDGDSFDTLFLDAPGPRRGLLTLAGDEPVSRSAIPVVPEGAAWFLAMSISPSRAWDTVWGAFDEFAPPIAIAEVRGGLAQVERELGFGLREDLLAALGDEFVAYAELPENGVVPNVVVSIGVDDRAKAAKVLDSILRAGDVPVRQVDYQGYEMHLIDVPDADVPLSPCFILGEERILASITVAGLRSAVRQFSPERTAVTNAPNFERAFQGLEWRNASYVQYIDVPRLASFGHNMLESFLPGVDRRELPFDPALLPARETIVGHLRGWSEVGRSGADGILWEGRTLSLASLLALGARFLQESPGFPPYTLERLFAGGPQRRAGEESPVARPASVRTGTSF